MRWRPIKTIPRDGTTVLIAYRRPLEHVGAQVSVGYLADRSVYDQLYNVPERPECWAPLPAAPRPRRRKR